MPSTLARFRSASDRVTADLRHRRFVREAMGKYYVKRDEYANRFTSWEDARAVAARIKHAAVNRLDEHLRTFADNLERRGGHVYFASDGRAARQYVVDLCHRKGAKRLIKSKTMTGEEIGINAALEVAGLAYEESDLGEYIVHLRKEEPYHFVFPAMHLTRGQINELFQKELGTTPTDDPEELTMIARRVMRELYCRADVGITGANFAVAETGTVSVTENEGNSRLTAALPKVHVVIMGMEKVLPTLDDLALLLPMLATAGAGQPLTCYNSMYSGPRRVDEPDGPDELHVILLDNGRSRLLADPEQRDALHCIRCGACLNVCPIFKNVGGHTYGTTYQGPIGSVITPHLKGLQDWKHLSHASSLCGACTSVCPVKIDLHHHLLHNRRNAARLKPGAFEKPMMRAFAWLMTHPAAYRVAGKIGWLTQPLSRVVCGKPGDPLRGWTQTRDFPPIPRRTFREQWRSRQARRTTSSFIPQGR